ncbi:MAG: hypothetical protein IKO57_04510 [Treponema sp.]|nr:hypothetical protein [Treponema sp.]
MSKLRVKNFGPISAGFDSADGFIEFKKCTIFIGDQGTGKSTVAKIFSVCSWLEKSFFRGDYDIGAFEVTDFEELCRNQLLETSFNKDTELEYIGTAYHFLYKDSLFVVRELRGTINSYLRPKIMYIPSERNILSVVKNVEELDNIPPMLRLLRRRYLQASEYLKGSGEFNLPLSGYKAFVNKSSGETFIHDEKTDSLVPLICASSGLQSIVPSSLVTDYLASLSSVNMLEKIRILNDKNYEQLKRALESESSKSELERYVTSGISKSISDKSLAEIKAAANKFTNACFINIVEEPEQNLFPDSQMRNVYFLISAANRNESNSIVITTHSPYILSDITLAAKAFDLLEKGVPKERLGKIVPIDSLLDGKKLVVYETQRNGSITKLDSYDNLPSDENLLNRAMAEGNEVFADFIDLEQEFCV